MGNNRLPIYSNLVSHLVTRIILTVRGSSQVKTNTFSFNIVTLQLGDIRMRRVILEAPFTKRTYNIVQ
ncbi:hypothetical protein NMY3_03246 [Candidatus Nitrosocosmicus oleophilus]|uniref:Uncharacterized protein n=1 Tax=Candidatus Nitrosocosmicus oleophilus TaxID=1353260 RepID=A0A654M4C3_9ARCH|nr:hypothetical protein NMY3_03246 [Candidatus Nitrosocosmicus oleophilus]